MLEWSMDAAVTRQKLTIPMIEGLDTSEREDDKASAPSRARHRAHTTARNHAHPVM